MIAAMLTLLPFALKYVGQTSRSQLKFSFLVVQQVQITEVVDIIIIFFGIFK
jgi:hypothetical protein